MKTLILILTGAAALLAQSFPGAVYTPLVAKDNVRTTLSLSMAPGDGVAFVKSSAGWVPNAIAYVCDTVVAGNCTGTYEVMLVTSVASNALTLTRGYGGTSAVSHAAGLAISNSIASVYNKSVTDEVLAVEQALGPNLVNTRPAWSQVLGTKQGTTSVPQMAGANSGTTGAPLCDDANGNSTTSGCLVAMAAKNAADYNFAPQSCTSLNVCSIGGVSGAALIVGANVVTLTPVPLGLNGSDTGHYVYISGGSGAAEAGLITGGSASSGAASGTLIFTTANTHTGAWTIASASGGVGEAVCAQGASGKPVAVFIPTVLNANVGACVAGTTPAYITYPGAALTGTGALRGTVFSSQAEPADFTSLPSPMDFQRVSINNFPLSSEFGPTVPVFTGITGAIKMKTNGPFQAQGLGGWAMTGGDDQAAVGAYTSGLIGVQPTAGHTASAFGLNVNTGNCIGGAGCFDGSGFTSTNNYGVEIDVTMMKGPASAPALNAIGLYFSGASSHQPVGLADAIEVDHLGAFHSPTIPWKNAFLSKNGAANVGLSLGTLLDTGASNSQSVEMHSRTAGGVDNKASLVMTPSGDLYVTPGGAIGQLLLADSNLNIAATVTPSGTAPVFKIFSAAVIGAGACTVTSGTGSPNSVVTGSPCDMYLNKAGGAGTTMYVKESGTATNTGWVGK